MRTEIFRKTASAIIILVLAMIFAMSTAWCEQTAWDCPECGRTGNTGNYCGNCAHPAPWIRKQDFRNVGSNVFFGHYEQDNNLGNGPEEIEWIVLGVDTSMKKALLLSRYGLDVQPYNQDDITVTWDKCTLRTWLNDTFMKKAFTTKEQAGILLTSVDNSISQGYRGWGENGGKDTQDKIFLLSYAEANQYLGVTPGNRNNTKSRVSPTVYAIKQGAILSSSDKTEDGSYSARWWLRSPVFSENRASDVFFNGMLGCCNVNLNLECIRPALWVNLKSDIF